MRGMCLLVCVVVLASSVGASESIEKVELIGSITAVWSKINVTQYGDDELYIAVAWAKEVQPEGEAAEGEEEREEEMMHPLNSRMPGHSQIPSTARQVLVYYWTAGTRQLGCTLPKGQKRPLPHAGGILGRTYKFTATRRLDGSPYESYDLVNRVGWEEVPRSLDTTTRLLDAENQRLLELNGGVLEHASADLRAFMAAGHYAHYVF